MSKLLIFIAALLLSETLLAQWKAETTVDSMTDEVKKSAFIKNLHGHKFTVYRIAKGDKVWANFSLSDKKFDQVNWRKPPIYRIDKNKPKNLQAVKDLHNLNIGINAYYWEPKWVNFLFGKAKNGDVPSDDVISLMEGKKIVFRYFLSTGGYKDTSFILDGAAEAIANALDISAEIDHGKVNKKREYNEVFKQELNKCKVNGRGPPRKPCRTYVFTCRKKAENDISKLKQCILDLKNK